MCGVKVDQLCYLPAELSWVFYLTILCLVSFYFETGTIKLHMLQVGGEDTGHALSWLRVSTQSTLDTVIIYITDVTMIPGSGQAPHCCLEETWTDLLAFGAQAAIPELCLDSP